MTVWMDRRRGIALLAPVIVATLGTGCRRAVGPLIVPGRSSVALTGGTNTSMIYLARTTGGARAIDLGWRGHRRALARTLSALVATGSVTSSSGVYLRRLRHRRSPVLETASLYRGHRFPREVIAHAVRLYLRFALSFRDVEELLAERGVRIREGTVR